MGLTCANLHVFLGDENLESRLHECLAALNYRLAEDAEQEGIAVGFAPQWASIVDLEAEGVVTPELIDFATKLSQSMSRPMLLGMVADSDDFAYCIFDQGKLVDAFSTNDEMLPCESRRSYPKTRADRLNRLFQASISRDDMGRLLNEPQLFADHQLESLCQWMRIPSEMGMITARDTPRQQLRHYRRETTRRIPDVKHQAMNGPVTRMVIQQTGSFGFEIRMPASNAIPSLRLAGTPLERGLVQVEAAGGTRHGGLQHVKRTGASALTGQKQASNNGFEIRFTQTDGAEAEDLSLPEVTLLLWCRLRAIASGEGTIECELRFDPEQATRLGSDRKLSK